MKQKNEYQIAIPHDFRLPEMENICITEKGTKIIVDPKCTCVDVSVEE